jgi:hypothetical protein
MDAPKRKPLTRNVVTKGIEQEKAESGTLRRIEGKLDKVLASGAGAGAAPVVSEHEAQRVFLLMKRLEGAAKQRKAPLPTVFRLTVLEGHSQGKLPGCAIACRRWFRGG